MFLEVRYALSTHRRGLRRNARLIHGGPVGPVQHRKAGEIHGVCRRHQQHRAESQPNVVDIEIKRWSTESERDQLLKLFRERGQDGLLPALQKAPPIGSIRTPQSLAYDLHFSWQTPQPDGGRMIFLMTDRPINAWEAWNRPRTIDYPFTLIQLQVDKDGRGVGKASIATQIREENGTIVLENFSSTPVVLNEVRRVN